MSEEREFEVIDRRRVNRSGDAAPDATAVGAESEPTGETEADSAGVADFPQQPLSAVDAAVMSISIFNELAWIKMGLVPDPATGELGSDLTQARLAIDCAGDLAHRIESHVDPKTHRELEVLLQNLKLNYVRRHAESGSAPTE